MQLRPIIRQDTRWGPTFAMAHRYFALQQFLDAEDEDIMGLLPSPACNRRLKKLHAELKDIESVSKALQAEDVSLLDARVWFDDLIAAHPTFVIYIVYGALFQTKWVSREEEIEEVLSGDDDFTEIFDELIVD
ncbi:hypothetical protein JG687_00000600 [Phytophthora cactorum]|uniref:Uncharacterized protein n=1 Tax=Phytophthora cactorum TaxID=29920 RepID=A0A8T1V2A3_9STRA|nr:hypothetical protein JG687_00000600 [Phytophthora cactorum]